MRIFYVYNISDSFSSIYDKYPYKLYKMLEDAYLTNKYSPKMSSLLYNQILNHYNKLFINNYLNINNKLDMYYYNKDNLHLISKSNEYSKLLVSSYCLKVKTTLNYPKFFDNINNYSDNIFVCDFNNKDYFWLKRIKKNQETLTKQ